MKLHKRIERVLWPSAYLPRACRVGAFMQRLLLGHDETMYVNLDHYGAIDETRIVKSYSVISEIVDFETTRR